MENIKNALQCPICMDVATIPVQKTCCDARTRPGCLSCVRRYYRNTKKKSFGGCGCDSNKYRLAKDLWMVRDAVGCSKCPNECGERFDTTSECYKHATGDHENPEKNCPESYMTCPIYGCGAKFKRKHEEEHKYLHDCMYCHVCGRPVFRDDFVRHVKDHMMSIIRFTVSIHEDHPGELKNFKKTVGDSWVTDDDTKNLKNYVERILSDES